MTLLDQVSELFAAIQKQTTSHRNCSIPDTRKFTTPRRGQKAHSKRALS
jgi:hypothetical protein